MRYSDYPALTAYDDWAEHVVARFCWLWSRHIDEHLRGATDAAHDEEFEQFKRALAACDRKDN